MLEYDVWADVMRMRDDARLRPRMRHARQGFVPIVGEYGVMGSEDAEPAIARIIAIDIDRAIDLQRPATLDEWIRAGVEAYRADAAAAAASLPAECNPLASERLVRLCHRISDGV